MLVSAMDYLGGNIRVVDEEENVSWVQLSFKESLSGNLWTKFF